MKSFLCCFILLIIFSCKQQNKDNNHLDVIDTQMAELKKEPQFVFADSIKCLKFWNVFFNALAQSDTSSIIKMSLKNVYCPIYQKVYNYYSGSKIVPLWFFLNAPYKQNYVNSFAALLKNNSPIIYHNNYLDDWEAAELGIVKENTVAGFSVNFETKEIAGNYQLRATHQFRFIGNKDGFKFIGLIVGNQFSRYQYDLMPIDSLYFPINSIDTSTNKWYSKYLLHFKEPILCKRQSADEVYRFTWLRSFNNPVVVRFEKHNGKYTLYTKELLDYDGYIPSKLKINTQQKMSEKAWKVLKEKLNDIDFENLVSKDPEPPPMDGARWILESSTKSGYHFTERNMGNKKYRACGRFLLLLSGLHLTEAEIY